jgi:hypothetical protein
MLHTKYIQGKYSLLNPNKYVGDKSNIIYRSSWELKFFTWADKNSSVINWGSEIHYIPYFSTVDNKIRRYFPDLFIKVLTKENTEKTYIVEIKPLRETLPPVQPKRKTKTSDRRYMTELVTYQKNQDKWKSANDFANKYNMEFIVITEKELGIK